MNVIKILILAPFPLIFLLVTKEDEVLSSTALIRATKYAVIAVYVTHISTCVWHVIACTCSELHADEFECLQGSWAHNVTIVVNATINETAYRNKYTADKIQECLSLGFFQSGPTTATITTSIGSVTCCRCIGPPER